MCNVVHRLSLPIVVLSLAWTMSFTAPAFAAPIELENDAGGTWSDAPCLFGIVEQFCNFVNGQWVPKPFEEIVGIVGAPRLVPDASNAGSLVDIAVDFLGVSVDANLFGPPGNFSWPLILNVFDLNLNPVLQPGGNVPLQLTYPIQPSASLGTEASDVFLKLGAFDGFNLLPAGDLIFNVSFAPKLGITDRTDDRPDLAYIVTLSGAGTTQVPEPATLLLLLSGVAITGLGARMRRV